MSTEFILVSFKTRASFLLLCDRGMTSLELHRRCMADPVFPSVKKMSDASAKALTCCRVKPGISGAHRTQSDMSVSLRRSLDNKPYRR